MLIYINYKNTLFERENLTLIHGKPTLEIILKIWNKIKDNSKTVYSNIGGGAHNHIVLVLTNVKYALIFNTPFVYLNHPGPLIIMDGTTAHKNSNMWIMHTEEVHIFREVTGVDKSLVQQIVSAVKEAYIVDIRNCTTNSIKDTVDDVLTNLQENHGPLMPH